MCHCKKCLTIIPILFQTQHNKQLKKLNPNLYNNISTYRCERCDSIYHEKTGIHVFKMQSGKNTIISFECTNGFVLNNLKQFNNRQQKYIQNIKNQKYMFMKCISIKTSKFLKSAKQLSLHLKIMHR